MLVLHKPWSVKNPLDEILNDKQRTVDMFKEMVGSRSLPIHVLSEYNRVVKYAQEYKIEALAKEGTSQDRVLLVKDMDTDQLEQHVEWEQSCHISAQSTTKASNTFFHMTADIGLDTRSQYYSSDLVWGPTNISVASLYHKYVESEVVHSRG